MTSSISMTTTVVDRFLDDLQAATVGPDLYADDAELDAVVPGWRFAKRGGAAIVAEYARWFAHPGTLEEVRRHPLPGGEVVEYTVHWVEDGVAHAARHIHVLEIDGESGLIRVDRVWCGGRWDADLLARMDAAGHAG
jgi:hypothetical protein